MSQNSCCVPGCEVTRKDGIPLHRFPNPDVNAEKFNSWVSKIGGAVATMDNFDVYSNRRVCHKHFEEIHKYPRNRLCKLAIPVLYLPEQRHIESVTLPDRPSTSGFLKIPCDIHKRDQLFTEPVTIPALCSMSDIQEISSEVQMTGHQQHIKRKRQNKDHKSTKPKEQLNIESVTLPDLPSTSGFQKIPCDIHKRDQLFTEPVTMPPLCSMSDIQEISSEVQITGHQQHIKRKRQNKDHKYKSIKPKGLYVPVTKYREFKKLLKQLKKSESAKVAFKRKYNLAKKMTRTTAFSIVSSKMSTTAKIFCQMQVSQSGKKKLGRRFTLDQKILALSLSVIGVGRLIWVQ